MKDKERMQGRHDLWEAEVTQQMKAMGFHPGTGKGLRGLSPEISIESVI